MRHWRAVYFDKQNKTNQTETEKISTLILSLPIIYCMIINKLINLSIPVSPLAMKWKPELIT